MRSIKNVETKEHEGSVYTTTVYSDGTKERRCNNILIEDIDGNENFDIWLDLNSLGLTDEEIIRLASLKSSMNIDDISWSLADLWEEWNIEGVCNHCKQWVDEGMTDDEIVCNCEEGE